LRDRSGDCLPSIRFVDGPMKFNVAAPWCPAVAYSRTFCLISLLLPFPCIASGGASLGHLRHHRVAQDPGAEIIPGLDLTAKVGVPLNATVLRRVEEEYQIAKAADVESEGAAESALSSQQSILAGAAQEAAEDASDAARPAVPESKASEAQAIKWARGAQRGAEDAEKTRSLAETAGKEAARQAAEQVMEMVRTDAIAAAVDADKKGKDYKATRGQRVAESVVAAMEPYHLALLRAQKASQQDYEKSKSAMDTAQQLATDGQKQAADAQALQAAGMAVQAGQMMMMAHGSMEGAKNMKAWAEKMYNTANQLQASLGHYQLSASMAASNAAATTLFNKPPELPDDGED